MNKVFRLAAALILLLAGSAWAQEFSADAVNTSKGQEQVMRLYFQNGNMRVEKPGAAGYNIVRKDQGKAYMVFPSRKMYLEIALDEEAKHRTTDKLAGEVSRKLLGEETIEGYPTQKFEIETEMAGQKSKVVAWISKDLAIPLKIEAMDGSVQSRLTNIKTGPQKAELFELPKGFTKMDNKGHGNMGAQKSK